MSALIDRLRGIDNRQLTWIGIGLAILLFFALNLLARNLFTSVRLDVTEERLFTLSQGTKDVLADIEEPIDLRLYYTASLDEAGAYFASHAGRVRELLAEYSRLSDGKVRIERLDPEPFSTEEDLAVAEGLQSLPIANDGTQAYFGLAGRNSTDDAEVIAYLAPERADFLEYDLTRMVYDLGHPEKPEVGILGNLPLMGSPFNQGQPWLVVEAMRQFFNLRLLNAGRASIEEGIEVLMLAQPEQLDEASLYAIDQFVMRGGRVFALIDPFAETLAGGPGQPTPEGGDAIAAMEPLFAAWGVGIEPGKVVADAELAQRVGARINGRQTVVQYLPWLGLEQGNFAENSVITAEFELLSMNTVGTIFAREGASTTVEPLALSSTQSMKIDVGPLRLGPDPAALIAAFEPSGQRHPLIARVSGAVTSAFADGPPESVMAIDPSLVDAHLGSTAEPLNMILVADADMLSDRNWIRQQNVMGQPVTMPVANNGDFAVNSLDFLSGSQSLIGLRGRGLNARPFDVIEQMAQDAEFKFRNKEQELLAEIEKAEGEIRRLQEEEQQSGVILTGAQQDEIERFRAEMISLRQELRDVQRSLRQDVEGLAGWLTFFNIALIPIIIGMVAIALAFIRRAKGLQRAKAAPA